MRRTLATLFLALTACGGGALSSVPCGTSTCGPTQYCRNTCLCCGVAGGTPSSKSECVSIPAGCSGADLCSCPQATSGGACTQSTRSVDIPCA